MKVTYEVLRYNVADSEGHTFAPGCFANAEGKEVPVFIGFDETRRIGSATLRSSETALLAEVDAESVARAVKAGLVAAYGGTLTDPMCVGFVLPENKIW